MKRRIRRLKHFENRAEAFTRAIEKGEGFYKTRMDIRPVKVGVGQHKRLIQKKEHYQLMRREINEAITELKTNPAKHFTLVELGFSEKHGVQEYSDKPSVQMFYSFFHTIRSPKREPCPPNLT